MLKTGQIKEPFNVNDVRLFTENKGWDITDTYINVCLANAAAENHSLTYKKYFESIGDGKYKISLNIIV